jgi:hypothetical protein
MSARHSPTIVILICLLVSAIVTQIWSAFSWGRESYQMTEWLINYAGGFVRRGLPGELVWHLSKATGAQANHIVIIVGLTSYLALAGWLLRHATPTFPVSLILSCIILGFPAYQDSIIRKDCLGLLLLLGCLSIDQSRHSRPTAIMGMNLLACLAILSHEAFVFYAIPALMLFSHRERHLPDGFQIIRRSFALLPAAGCFLLTTWYHGTPEIAKAVNDSWLPLWRIITPGDPHVSVPAAAIQALGWTSEQGLSLSIYMLTSGWYQPLAWTMVFTISFVLVLLFTNRDADKPNQPDLESRIQVTAILLAQLAFIAPLFLLGVDYGRWLFLWVASSMIFRTCGLRAPVWLESLVAEAFRRARAPILLRKVPARDWYLLVFGVPVCWNLHNFLVAGPVPRHLDLFRSWF